MPDVAEPDRRGARRRRAQRSAAIVLTLAAGGAAAARGAPDAAARVNNAAQNAPDSTAVTPAMVAAGRAIFHSRGTCFACHGPQLQGSQVAPTLKPHKWRDAKNGDLPEIFRIVTHGVPGTLMVAYPGGITRADAANVASYVWSVTRGKVQP